MSVSGDLISELLISAIEEGGHSLRGLESSALKRLGCRLVLNSEIYLLEQIYKICPEVLILIGREMCCKGLRAAMKKCNADGFVFLWPHAGESLSIGEVQNFMNDLTSRGFVDGLERSLKICHIVPQLRADTISRAFEVLISSARPEAADYIRQLSGVNVPRLREAGRKGVIRAVESGRFNAAKALWESAKLDPAIDSDLWNTLSSREQNDSAKFTKILETAIKCGCRSFLDGFSDKACHSVSEGFWKTLYYVFLACKDSDPGLINWNNLRTGDHWAWKSFIQFGPIKDLTSSDLLSAASRAVEGNDLGLAVALMERGVDNWPEDALGRFVNMAIQTSRTNFFLLVQSLHISPPPRFDRQLVIALLSESAECKKELKEAVSAWFGDAFTYSPDYKNSGNLFSAIFSVDSL